MTEATERQREERRRSGVWARARAGETLAGAWCALADANVVEALTHLDLDWLMLDAEHGFARADACAELLRAAQAGGCAALVRVPNLDPSLIGRALDLGADGIMVPRIHSATAARLAVAACYYPPRGTRGVGPVRAAGYGTDRDYLAQANRRVAPLLQIESREGVENIDEILEVSRIGAVFIGPNDLAASLGHFADLRHGEVEEAIQHVLARCRERRVPTGCYCSSGVQARQRADEGFQFVNVVHDVGALMAGARSQLDAWRGAD